MRASRGAAQARLKIIASPAYSIARVSRTNRTGRRTRSFGPYWGAEPHASIRSASDWDVAEDLALIDARGHASQRIQAIGPLARAAVWECISIPDIRLQCQEIAQALATAEAA